MPSNWLIPICVLGIAACGPTSDLRLVEAGDSSSFAIRDSAGIRIAESAAPLWGADEFWHLSATPRFELGGDDGVIEEMALDPASAFQLSDGRFVVADGITAGWHGLLFFDGLGNYIETVGGRGQGPGEFQQVWWGSPYRGDSIAVYDYATHQVSVFDDRGTFARRFRLPNWSLERPAGTRAFSEGAGGVFDDGSILAYPMGIADITNGPGPAWYVHEVLRVAPDGSRWDTLGVFGIDERYWAGGILQSYPFGRLGVEGIHDSLFYHATGETFEIRAYGAGGLLRIVRREHMQKEVTQQDKYAYTEYRLERAATVVEGRGTQAVERVRKQLEETSFPANKPALSAIVFDSEGNLWVENFRWGPLTDGPDPQPVDWSVFDRDGRWLGDVQVHAGVRLTSIGRDHAIGFSQDSNDVKHVLVYALTKPVL